MSLATIEHSSTDRAMTLACHETTAPDDALGILHQAIGHFGSRIALVSSFGAEAAILLDLVATVDRRVPIIFLDTEKLFPETLAYRDALVARLGLTDVRSIRPGGDSLRLHDPQGDLWKRDADRCCGLRKTQPLQAALSGFSAWITGRKRFHAVTRQAIPVFEQVPGGRMKVNPLAHWGPDRIAAQFEARNLPRHPLEAFGFASVGCATCTLPVAPGADRRSGRWAGQAKTECGIHLGENI